MVNSRFHAEAFNLCEQIGQLMEKKIPTSVGIKIPTMAAGPCYGEYLNNLNKILEGY